MAEPTTQDAGIAALDALDSDVAAPEVQEEIVDPIVAAATKPEANIEPAANIEPPRPIVSKKPGVITRLQLAEKNLVKAQQGLEKAERELSEAALAESKGPEVKLTLVELNALARKQQAPEAAARRKVGELINQFGLLRRPHQTHSPIIPLPSTEAKVE
jgi:hypothetical protein